MFSSTGTPRRAGWASCPAASRSRVRASEQRPDEDDNSAEHREEQTAGDRDEVPGDHDHRVVPEDVHGLLCSPRGSSLSSRVLSRPGGGEVSRGVVFVYMNATQGHAAGYSERRMDGGGRSAGPASDNRHLSDTGRRGRREGWRFRLQESQGRGAPFSAQCAAAFLETETTRPIRYRVPARSPWVGF